MRPSFPKIEFTCVSTVLGLTTRRSQIPRFESPWAISSSTSRSRGELAERAVRTLAPEELRDDLRVDRGSAAADASHGVQEVVDLKNAVLQEVAEALGRVTHECERVRRLDDLREQEHGDLWCSVRISTAARAPSSVWVGGMRTSTIATSGLKRLTAFISSSAFAA
jgi:hypothetical protein